MDLRTHAGRRSVHLVIAFFLVSTLAFSQWDVAVFMQPFPSAYLSDWEHNPTVGSLSITNNTGRPFDVRVYLTVARTPGGIIAAGNSGAISVPPGIPTQINSDRFIDWNTVTYDQNLKGAVVQSGRLPEGEYNACITVKDENGAVLASNVCASFTIVYPAPPSLFFPVDGDTLESPYPVFTWTPVQVPPAYQLHYILKIVEVLPGQIPHQALEANPVQYENDNLTTTNVQYPIAELPLVAGKTYAWQVQAVDENGFPPSGNEGRSEIWTFAIKEALTTHRTQISPLTIEIVPEASGSFADFASSTFESVADKLDSIAESGGTIQLPLISHAHAPSDTNASWSDRFVVEAARHGIYIDRTKKSMAIRGEWKRNGRTYDVLFTAVWGPRHDPRQVTLTLKGPMLSRLFPKVFSGLTEEYVILSLADFTLKPDDLPDSAADFFGHELIGNDTVQNEVELKQGINFLGKFDLHHFPGTVMKALGIQQPFALLKGHISPRIDVVFSPDNGAKWDAAWEGVISASIPVTRSIIPWMPKADLELEFGYEAIRTDTLLTRHAERTIRAKLSLSASLTFGFLRNVRQLNDTIEVKGTIARERSFGADSNASWVATLEANDILKFPKFENVFSLHNPTLEWNISQKRLKWEGQFDFGRFEKVGTIEVEIGKKDTVSRPDTLTKAPFGGVPTPFKQAELLAAMSKTPQKPLTGGKPSKKLEWKVTAKFRPSALRAFKASEILGTALNLGENLFGGDGGQHSPPEISEFLNTLPSFEELSMSFRPGSLGSMVITGKTTYNNSSTEIIAARAESPTKKGFILGLKPQNWSIRNYFPDFSMPGLDNVTLSNVALVFSNVEGAMPSTELTDEEFAFYSAAYESKEFTVVIKPGLNLVASVPSEGLVNNGPLAALMNKLGASQGNILLQGSLGRRVKDIYLLGFFPSMHPEGSPEWFNSGQLAIEFTGQPSVGLVGGLSLNIHGDVRNFIVKTKVGKEGLVLTGGMIADSGWVSPFGIHGLTLNKVVLLLGLTPAGSVQLGFEGDLVVGEKDIHTAVLVAISVAGVPTNFMFDGESRAGFGVSDLVIFQEKIAAARSASSPAIPLDHIPPLYIKEATLKFAPKDSPELGISRGMTVKGLLELKPASGTSTKDIASALFDVGDDGIVARGNIAPFSIGPVKLQQASMDLTLTRNDQHFALDGKVDLGFMNGDIAMTLTKTNAMFHAEAKIFNRFAAELDAKGVLNLKQPAFVVHAVMKNDFSGALAREMRRALIDAVAGKKDEATAAANAAAQRLQAAINAREAAQRQWAKTPAFPRKPKVAARNAWERAIAKATGLRVAKELKEGKMRRWTLARNFLARIEQQRGTNMIVVRRAEFDADLTKLKTGAVKKMEIALNVGDRQFNLNVAGWNFKNIGKSAKDAARHVTEELFASFQ